MNEACQPRTKGTAAELKALLGEQKPVSSFERVQMLD